MARISEEIEKQGFHHGNLKETASTLAYNLIKNEGVHSLNLRQIAKECGVDHSALYRHFKNKDALVASVILQGFKDLNTSQEKAQPDTAEEFLSNYVNFAFEAKKLYSLMFSELGRKFYNTPDIESEIQKLIRSAACAIGDISHEDKISSDLRDKVIRAWSMTHGFINLWHNRLFRAKSDKLAKQYILQQLAIYAALDNNT